MTDSLTKSDLNDLEARLDKRFEKMGTKFDKRFDNLFSLMNSFANDVNTGFERIEKKLVGHDQEFAKLNKQYDYLVQTMDSFIARIDIYKTELAACDHKIERSDTGLNWLQLKPVSN